MLDTLAFPEVFLAIAGMAILIYGVFRSGNPTRPVSWLVVLALVVALLAVWFGPEQGQAFGGMFVLDGFAVFLKILVLLGSSLAIILSLDYVDRENMARFEFPVLLLFATLGMLVMLSANDLISLYVGFELQSLALYVVAAFRRDNIRSTEAGLKYFVLGALSSGILLYGASMIYGFAGTTNFDGIATALIGNRVEQPSIGLIVGIVFLSAGLAFKVSAVPFHMWTPDVYEGAPTPVTAFFAVAPKIAAIGLFVRVLVDPFLGLVDQWQQIIIFISIASMVLGGFAAINQANIKRLMAYSSISNIGYALVGLAPGTEAGVRGVLLYMTIYLFMTLGTFAVILCMRQKGRMVEGIDDLAGLSKTHPMMAAAMAIFMFSMAGIPPLAGFFGKLYVFLAAIEAGLYTLAVIGVVTSVVAAFYYLRIIKIMYFDEATDSFDRPLGWEASSILGGSALVILLFFLFQAPLIDGAGAAAASLFAG
ncbi:NADH-quinone oxidoreductase subunit NuoN [Rhodospirillaceae bacterium SYSU D60014]|uniref:NADH-quinone oxidoreductase subunit NuoN n=1 Tax=Virgifigura deserti TaxID=2268457 RepID=UPI000E6651A7